MFCIAVGLHTGGVATLLAGNSGWLLPDTALAQSTTEASMVVANRGGFFCVLHPAHGHLYLVGGTAGCQACGRGHAEPLLVPTEFDTASHHHRAGPRNKNGIAWPCVVFQCCA